MPSAIFKGGGVLHIIKGKSKINPKVVVVVVVVVVVGMGGGGRGDQQKHP